MLSEIALPFSSSCIISQSDDCKSLSLLLLKSANANAENNFSIRSNTLKISKIYANQGKSLKRVRARARGRADTIIKRNSHITVELSE